MNIRLNKETTTYMPLLIRAVLATRGPILEMGAGLFSTPLLHWFCAENGRPLVTLEKDREFYEFARKFQSKTHTIRHVDDWKTIDTKTHWSVVLVDQDSDRALTAIRLKDSADVIILHDTDQEKAYNHDTVYSHFTYVYHWKFCKPYTAAISNRMDLKAIGEPSWNTYATDHHILYP